MKKFQMLAVGLLCWSSASAQVGVEPRAVKGGTVTVAMSNIPGEDAATINRVYTVDLKDGTINMPYLDKRVYVAGLTSRAVEDLLLRLYTDQKIYSQPIVQADVTTEDVKGTRMQRYIHMTGSVGAQKNMPYREGITLIEALIECGGLGTYASRYIQVTRKGVTKRYDYYSAKDRAIILYPGDTIFVGEKGAFESTPKSIGP